MEENSKMEDSSRKETLRNVLFVGAGEISVVKSTDCSSKRHELGSQKTHGDSKPSVT